VSDVACLELDSFEPITSHPDTFLWTYMSQTQDNSLLERPNRPQLGLMRPSCTLPVLTPDHVMSTFWRIDNKGGHSDLDTFHLYSGHVMVRGFSSISFAVFASPVTSVYEPPPRSYPHPPTLTPRLGGFYGNIYLCSLV